MRIVFSAVKRGRWCASAAMLLCAGSGFAQEPNCKDSTPVYVSNVDTNFLINQLEQDSRWDIVMGGVWDGVSKNSAGPRLVQSPSGGRFGQSVSMGDFDGDGHVDVLICAPQQPATIDSISAMDIDNMSPAEVSAIDTSNTRFSAGKVYLLYGPFGGTGGTPWPDRVGKPSELAPVDAPGATDNLHFLDQEPDPNPDRYIDQAGWFNAFDIASEPRELVDRNDARIEGVVFHGIYGAYSGTPNVLMGRGTGQVIATPSQGSALAQHGGSIVDPHYGLDGGSSSDIIWSGLECANPGTDTELMGAGSRFVGDINHDGCDDIVICAPTFDEFDESDPSSEGRFFIDVDCNPGFDPVEDCDHENACDQAELACDQCLNGRRFAVLDHGRAYIIFGQGTGNNMTRYEGKMDVATLDDTTPLQGVTLRTSSDESDRLFSWHDKLGKDVSPASGIVTTPGGCEEFVDFNGDGIADFAISAGSFDADLPTMFGAGPSSRAGDPLGADNGYGYVAVIYGKERTGVPLNPWHTAGHVFEMPGVLNEPTCDGSTPPICKPEGVYFVGSFEFGYAAYVGFGGDFDNDGYADLIIGEPNADIEPSGQGVAGWQNAGRAYLVYGRDSFPVVNNDPAAHFLGNNSSRDDDCSPLWLTLKADVLDGDDYEEPDGVHGVLGRQHSTQAYDDVTQGVTNPSAQSPAIPDATWVLRADDSAWDPAQQHPEDKSDQLLHGGAEAGWSVWTAGDVDRDGYSDLLIGAPDETSILGNEWGTGAHDSAFTSRGRAYLVYGYARPQGCQGLQDCGGCTAADEFTFVMDDAAVTGTPTTVAIFRGAQNGDRAGHSVMSAGDINDDGYGDFVIGADWADHPENGSAENTPDWILDDPDSPNYGHKKENADIGWPLGTIPPDDSHGPYGGDGMSDHLHTGGYWIDVNGNGEFDCLASSGTPLECTKTEPVLYNASEKHRDLGAAYIVYGTNTRFSGSVELNEVGTGPSGIPGVVLWGLTGSGFDVLNDSGPIEQFIAPMFGHSLAGGHGCDLNEDGIDDILVGVPQMARPFRKKAFPARREVGGVVAYYGVMPTILEISSAPDKAERIRIFVNILESGEQADINSDGHTDVLDLIELINN